VSPAGLPEGPRTAYWPLCTAVAAQKPRGASWASPCDALIPMPSRFKPTGATPRKLCWAGACEARATDSAPTVAPSQAIHRRLLPLLRLAPIPSPTWAQGARWGACTSRIGLAASGQYGQCAHCPVLYSRCEPAGL